MRENGEFGGMATIGSSLCECSPSLLSFSVQRLPTTLKVFFFFFLPSIIYILKNYLSHDLFLRN